MEPMIKEFCKNVKGIFVHDHYHLPLSNSFLKNITTVQFVWNDRNVEEWTTFVQIVHFGQFFLSNLLVLVIHINFHNTRKYRKITIKCAFCDRWPDVPNVFTRNVFMDGQLVWSSSGVSTSNHLSLIYQPVYSDVGPSNIEIQHENSIMCYIQYYDMHNGADWYFTVDSIVHIWCALYWVVNISTNQPMKRIAVGISRNATYSSIKCTTIKKSTWAVQYDM